MWQIVEGPLPVRPLADHHRYLFVIARADERREICVELSGTAMCCAPETLPGPIGEMVKTSGQAAVERHLSEVEPPVRVSVDTLAWRPIYRELSEAV